MSNSSTKLTEAPEGYQSLLRDLKSKIQQSRIRASLLVYHEQMLLNWHIGHELLGRQLAQGWGSKALERLALDLKHEFPDMKGFSRSNLMYMRAFAEAWTLDEIVQQPVGQLPWSHNLVLLTKLKDKQSRLCYASLILELGWNRNVLTMQIEGNYLERKGKAITNFKKHLPERDSDLAQEILKDPYKLDFLGLGDLAKERDIEDALIQHITQFLLELGAGFAYVGKQFHLEVGGDDFYLDLLFYHLQLRCYVVIEIKSGKFKPEHLGQLGFYMTAVDKQVKQEQDSPTIGLLLCKSKNKIVAEYALHDQSKPMGIAEYQLEKSLPRDIQSRLPTIQQIEMELEDKNAD